MILTCLFKYLFLARSMPEDLGRSFPKEEVLLRSSTHRRKKEQRRRGKAPFFTSTSILDIKTDITYGHNFKNNKNLNDLLKWLKSKSWYWLTRWGSYDLYLTKENVSSFLFFTVICSQEIHFKTLKEAWH